MSVIVVGLEQRHVPLDLFEQVAVGDEATGKLLGVLTDRDNISEAVVVSTCQRTEAYAVVDRFHDGVDEVRAAIADLAGVPVGVVEEHSRLRFDDEVAPHLFAVAAGLESAVVGETEVLGQVRRAWDQAQRASTSGPVLNALFRHAVETGKRVRTETAIARGVTSMSHGAVALAAARLPSGSLDGASVVLVGTGEMGTGILDALAGRAGSGWGRPASIVLANRTVGRARELAGALGTGGPTVLPTALDGLAARAATADVVFTAAAATHPIVAAADLAAARPPGAGPVLVVDLGVPRNVDRGRSAPGVEVLDIDDLRASLETSIAERDAEAQAAGGIVAEEVQRHRAASRARGAAPVIAALRSQAEALRAAELERLRAKRSDLTPEQWAQVDDATKAMLAKMLHGPTVALKESAGTPRGERLVEALRALFDL